MKTMPTINDLMKRLGYNRRIPSVEYNGRRSILNNLDKPVSAYAIGAGSIVFIWKNKHGTTYAHGYSAKFRHRDYYDGSFYELPIEQALKIIKKDETYVERCVNENDIKKIKKRYEPPIVADIQIKPAEESTNNHYIIKRLKNGKHRTYSKTYSWFIDKEYLLEYIMNAVKQLPVYDPSKNIGAQVRTIAKYCEEKMPKEKRKIIITGDLDVYEKIEEELLMEKI